MLENLNDLAAIKAELQPLQGQAFACTLWSNKNSEITKVKIG